jgi:hypothetical protein
MTIATIGNKVIDTETRTVSGKFSIFEDEEKKKKGVGGKTIPYCLNYSAVPNFEVLILAKGSSADIITLQNRIRSDYNAYSDGTLVEEDMANRTIKNAVSDEERIRRAAAAILGDKDTPMSHPMVVAMIAAARKAQK